MKNVILVSPWSKMLRDKSYNPKNYPFWPQVIAELKEDYDIIQIGVNGEQKLVNDFRTNLPMREIKKLILDTKTWISVDNFLPHLAHLLKKPGIVLWGESDPKIFGYPENNNLLKSRSYLRPDQFGIWDGRKHRPEVFVDAEVVINAVRG
jgi:ADP-heptose:LPS heptosyltransferase